jgi:hypothetical protein
MNVLDLDRSCSRNGLSSLNDRIASPNECFGPAKWAVRSEKMNGLALMDEWFVLDPSQEKLKVFG